MSKKSQNDVSLSEKADAAFEDVAVQIVKQAKQTGTPVIVWDKDHVKEIPPDELENLTTSADSEKSDS